MASSVILNPLTNSDRTRDSKKKKKKKSQMMTQNKDQQNHNSHNRNRWKSDVEQQLYSSKLLQALRQVRLSPSARKGRAVREVADQALAVAARGKTRWSRAILTNRLKLKFMKYKRQRVTVPRNAPPKKPRVSILRLKTKNLPSVQRRVRVLGRLVPGCRKEPLPVILEEATDYIAALEMQVRAMSALAELLSGSSAGSSSSSAPLSQLGSSRPPPC